MNDTQRLDAVALDAWYAVGAAAEMAFGRPRLTTLLGVGLAVARWEGDVAAWRAPAGLRPGAAAEAPAQADRLPLQVRFGYVWTSLGRPPAELFTIPEYEEPDRRNLNGGSVGVRASAPRVVENFLDMAHLPVVHEHYLGVEAHAEIKPYKVALSENGQELMATQCRIYQPLASIAATEGFEVEYTFRVPHPYCAVLYKSSAADRARDDVIAIFVQPVDEDRCVAHMMVSVLDEVNSDTAIRAFQQFIFGQDRPILENQIPARVPSIPLAETPIPIDAASSAYRRWLRDRGVRYGVLA